MILRKLKQLGNSDIFILWLKYSLERRVLTYITVRDNLEECGLSLFEIFDCVINVYKFKASLT